MITLRCLNICAEEAYGISRVLDNELIKKSKKGNSIRKKYRIQ